MYDAPEHLIPVKGGRIIESEFFQYIDYTDMKICSECYEPYGFWSRTPGDHRLSAGYPEPDRTVFPEVPQRIAASTT